MRKKTELALPENLTIKLKSIGKAIGKLGDKIADNTKNIKAMDERLTCVEFNEEITTEQEKCIRELAQKRVGEILSYSEDECAKYYRSFIQNLYKDAKKCGGLGSQISTTKRGNYQRCLNYIESWNPNGGSSKLKAQIDKRAKARLDAKRKGYVA